MQAMGKNIDGRAIRREKIISKYFPLNVGLRLAVLDWTRNKFHTENKN